MQILLIWLNERKERQMKKKTLALFTCLSTAIYICYMEILLIWLKERKADEEEDIGNDELFACLSTVGHAGAPSGCSLPPISSFCVTIIRILAVLAQLSRCWQPSSSLPYSPMCQYHAHSHCKVLYWATWLLPHIYSVSLFRC